MHRGPIVVHHRPKRSQNGALESRDSRGADRHEREDRDDGGPAEERGLHHPTNHGFDEFYGNLYHLNAEEEPEMYDYYPKEEFGNFIETIRPRGVIHSFAADVDDPTRATALGQGR